MWPERRGTMRRIASCVPWMTACRLISSWREMLSGVSSTSGVTGMIPALFTSTSSGPSCCSTSSRKAVKPGVIGHVERQPERAVAELGGADSAASRSRSPTATRAPSRANARAVARPMPRPPPVMATTFPERERGSLAI